MHLSIIRQTRLTGRLVVGRIRDRAAAAHDFVVKHWPSRRALNSLSAGQTASRCTEDLVRGQNRKEDSLPPGHAPGIVKVWLLRVALPNWRPATWPQLWPDARFAISRPKRKIGTMFAGIS